MNVLLSAHLFPLKREQTCSRRRAFHEVVSGLCIVALYLVLSRKCSIKLSKDGQTIASAINAVVSDIGPCYVLVPLKMTIKQISGQSGPQGNALSLQLFSVSLVPKSKTCISTHNGFTVSFLTVLSI